MFRVIVGCCLSLTRLHAAFNRFKRVVLKWVSPAAASHHNSSCLCNSMWYNDVSARRLTLGVSLCAFVWMKVFSSRTVIMLWDLGTLTLIWCLHACGPFCSLHGSKNNHLIFHHFVFEAAWRSFKDTHWSLQCLFHCIFTTSSTSSCFHLNASRPLIWGF